MEDTPSVNYIRPKEKNITQYQCNICKTLLHVHPYFKDDHTKNHAHNTSITSFVSRFYVRVCNNMYIDGHQSFQIAL